MRFCYFAAENMSIVKAISAGVLAYSLMNKEKSQQELIDEFEKSRSYYEQQQDVITEYLSTQRDVLHNTDYSESLVAAFATNISSITDALWNSSYYITLQNISEQPLKIVGIIVYWKAFSIESCFNPCTLQHFNLSPNGKIEIRLDGTNSRHLFKSASDRAWVRKNLKSIGKNRPSEGTCEIWLAIDTGTGEIGMRKLDKVLNIVTWTGSKSYADCKHKSHVKAVTYMEQLIKEGKDGLPFVPSGDATQILLQ